MKTALELYDPQIYELIRQEEVRQSGSIRLIPSENYVSKAVMTATGSCLTNKYSEGYPGRRYYEGQQVTDLVETIAINRAKDLFKADHANMQSYSGSVANLNAYYTLIKPGDTIMGMALADGGHLTHGSRGSMTSKIFRSVSYGVNQETGYIDYDYVRDLAKKEKPNLIISGATAYPRKIDFKIFGEIAKEVGAFHVSDIAHLSGLVVAGLHMSPVPYADIVSTTTHKTLRGPRGGMLLCRAEHQKALDRTIIPGQQGGPHMHTIAAVAVALAEANTPEFGAYAAQVIKNAARLGEKLKEYGFKLMTGGTDNHLLLIDLRGSGVTGKMLSKALDRARIVTNFNSVPGDVAPPTNPNGLRIGTPAMTTRGLKEEQMDEIASFIKRVADNVDNEGEIAKVSREVLLLTSQFPVPEHFIVPNQVKPPFVD
ncbi:MAG: serine hydroxymethyltransferase [Spirochaetales bacterium]|nr:serine hydroxymethyltransferase [Spirochaetales bacterium]